MTSVAVLLVAASAVRAREIRPIQFHAGGRAFINFLYRDVVNHLVFLGSPVQLLKSGRNIRPLSLLRAKMVAGIGPHDWRDRKIREWLLLLLRFAVTRESVDHMAVLSMADELDSLGMRWRPSAPRFFLRSSEEICEAILLNDDGHENAVLRRHIARINDPRLGRAFRAAVGL